jgi:hypothetical protein
MPFVFCLTIAIATTTGTRGIRLITYLNEKGLITFRICHYCFSLLVPILFAYNYSAYTIFAIDARIITTVLYPYAKEFSDYLILYLMA